MRLPLIVPRVTMLYAQSDLRHWTRSLIPQHERESDVDVEWPEVCAVACMEAQGL
jgi:hypothetical protein